VRLAAADAPLLVRSATCEPVLASREAAPFRREAGRALSPAQASSPAGFSARLGWTRIGSPGIFGEQTRPTARGPACRE